MKYFRKAKLAEGMNEAKREQRNRSKASEEMSERCSIAELMDEQPQKRRNGVMEEATKGDKRTDERTNERKDGLRDLGKQGSGQ